MANLTRADIAPYPRKATAMTDKTPEAFIASKGLEAEFATWEPPVDVDEKTVATVFGQRNWEVFPITSIDLNFLARAARERAEAKAADAIRDAEIRGMEQARDECIIIGSRISIDRLIFQTKEQRK